MALKVSILLTFTVFLINFTYASSECYQEGVTWDTAGQIDILLQVDFPRCTDIFLQNQGNIDLLTQFTLTAMRE